MMCIKDSIDNFLQKNDYREVRVRAVLFDMDGVLFDSMKNHTLAWYETIRELGIPCEREEFYLYEGATGNWTINTFFNRFFNRDATTEEMDRIYERKADRFNRLPEALPMEGAREILEMVKEKGVTPVLVTGSGQRSLLNKLERSFPGVFTPETMVTAFDVCNGKPHPEPYLQGLEKGNAEAFEAIAVENAPLGVQAAVAAGIFTVGVNTGPIPDNALTEAGAHLLYTGMPELALRFEKLLNI